VSAPPEAVSVGIRKLPIASASVNIGKCTPRLSAWALVYALAALFTIPVAGQANHGSAEKEPGSLIHSPLPSIPDDRVTGPDKAAPTSFSDDESCFMSPLTGVRPPIARVASLEVPGRARKDFQRACNEIGNKRLAKAEEHLRKALRADEKYSAAWVLLGQVLKAHQKPEDARNSCSQALRIDPNYLPADICLADLYAIEQKWNEMLQFANRAVALDPANEPHSYFYVAGAFFGLHRLTEAETSALKAVEVDKAKREPRAHFLLAQIYEIEHKPDAEASQLEEYLKSATDPQDVIMVKKYLADLAAHRKK
jgi:tetratricopeptide (TPR) repeat protein